MKKDTELEELKIELRKVIEKVNRRYAEMYFTSYDDPALYTKVRRATKSLMTRILNGTS